MLPRWFPTRMSSFDYDLAVIGGGPAGSTAAALARKRNLRVAVFEKERFPRFHIGESLLPNGNAILRESGAWPKVEQAGFIRKNGAYFFLYEGDAQKEVIFSQGMVRGLDYTYQVDRAKFDQLLLDHAETLGADIFRETKVTAVKNHTAGLELTARSAAGERVINARWLLDATGRENVFSSELKRELDPASLARRVAIYSHFRGVWRAAGYAAGHTTVVRLPEGWFWLIPISEEITSVGLVTTVESLRDRSAPPAEQFHAAVSSSSRLRELMKGATATMPFHVTTDYSYFRRRLAAERTLLIGDAAGFFDPIFSSGVYVALRSAQRAVELVARAHAADRPLSSAECERYTREFKQHARVFEKLIHAFYDNDSFAVFMSSDPPLNTARAINSIVAGHARLTWPLWWRFHFFLWACRLQKRKQIARPVIFSPAR